MQKAYDPEDDLQEEDDLDVLEDEEEDDEEEGWAEDYTGEDDW